MVTEKKKEKIVKDNPRVEVRETKIGVSGNIIEERYIGITGENIQEAYKFFIKVRKDLK